MVPRFRGVVSEEGDTFYPHARRAWLHHLGPLACEEVMVSVQPWMPITQEQRGFLRGPLVELYREFCGYATQQEAYDKLLEAVFTLQGQPRPSLSNAAADGFVVSEAIERCSAFLVTECGLLVPDPNVLRLEVATR